MKNKNIRRTFSLLLAVILIIFAVPIVNAAEDGVIRNDESGIPDTNLYNALLQIADTNEDGILTVEEAETRTSINIQGENISSLKGIKYFKNIKSLDITYCTLTTLDGLEGLPKLINLKIYCNQLTNIDNVVYFPNLIILCAWNNKISKLPDLRNFTNLDMIGNWPTDFSNNKLSRKEMMNKLPAYLLEYQEYYSRPNIDVWMETQTPDPESMNLVDIDTGIGISGLMHPDATLNVESVENTVENAISSFNITLVKDGNIIQPDGSITISIPSEYSDCDVFWIKDDGTKVNMNAEYVDGKYVFTTDHLSIYALVRNNIPTVPEPTETIPIPTETVPEPTETDPVPTETLPEPTVTDPVPTETVPEPTETDPVATETVPVTTGTDPINTEPPITEPTTTAPVVTSDTPSNGNNGSNGSSSNTPSSNSNNTSNGAVATGDMFGIDNSILIALILAATTAMVIANKRRKYSSK